MSLAEVQKILGRAVADAEFRVLLFTEPDRALEGYDLTEAEVTTLKQLPRDKFDSAASELGERTSMSTVVPSLGEMRQAARQAGADAGDLLDQASKLQSRPARTPPKTLINITQQISRKLLEQTLAQRRNKPK